MTYIFAFIMILLCYRISIRIFKNARQIEVCAISLSLFLVVYVVVSAVLFWGGFFSFYNCLGCSILVLVVAEVASYKCPRVKIDKKNQEIKLDYVLIGILLIGIIFSGKQFQIYFMGQDQGVYQTEAVQMVYGDFDVQHDFHEYHLLETENQRAEYKKMIQDAYIGFYPLQEADYPTIQQDKIKSEISGVYHGTHVFSSILALSGVLFGLENCTRIQILCYICTIILLYYTLGQVSENKIFRGMLTLLYVLSPLAIWIAKSCLIEMPLTLMIAFYLYILVHGQSPKWTLGIPILGITFLHVSSLQLIPLFVSIHLYLYLKERDQGYIVANIMMSLGLFISYVIMAFIGARYFYDNVSRLFWRNILNKENFLIFIAFLSLAIIICSIIFSWFLIRKGHDRFDSIADHLILVFSKLGIVISVFVIGCEFIKIGYELRPDVVFHTNVSSIQYYGTGIRAFGHSALWAFLMATGFLIIPICGWLILIRRKIFKTNIENVLVLFFVYTVFLSSAFIRKEVYFYYYYSRYLAFYLPAIILLGGYFFKSFVLKTNAVIVILSLCTMLPYSWTLCIQNDDSYVEWKTVNKLNTNINTNSAIIINEIDLNRKVGLIVRAMTDCGIFPVCSDFEREIHLLAKEYEHLYYLSYGEINTGATGLSNEYSVTPVCFVQNTSQKNPFNSLQWHYPLEIPKEKQWICLFEIK